MKEVTFDVAVSAVAKFHQDKKASDAVIDGLKKDHNNSVWERQAVMFAEAYGAAVQIVEMGEEERTRLFDSFNVKQFRANQNPFHVPIQILFRKTKDGKEIPDLSYAKYAAAFRAAKLRGWTAENFVSKVTSFSFEKKVKGRIIKKGRMDGLIRQDIVDNYDGPAEDRLKGEKFKACAWLNEQKANAFYEAQLTIKPPEDGRCVTVVQQWNEKTQKWVVRYVDERHTESFNRIAKDTVRDFRRASGAVSDD